MSVIEAGDVLSVIIPVIRVGFYQVMPMLEPIRELILNGANTAEIKRESMRLGIKTMRQSGLTKVKEGVTSLEEVLRVTVADD